jgi:hypothetical protein
MSDPEKEKPTTTTVEGLRVALEQLGLSSKGLKPELKQRFRKAMKKQKEEAEKLQLNDIEKQEELTQQSTNQA